MCWATSRLKEPVQKYQSSPSKVQLWSLCSGLALIDASEAMKELGEVKDALDMEVKQNFIDPLQNLHDKDLKEIQVRETLRFHSDQNKETWS